MRSSTKKHLKKAIVIAITCTLIPSYYVSNASENENQKDIKIIIEGKSYNLNKTNNKIDVKEIFGFYLKDYYIKNNLLTVVRKSDNNELTLNLNTGEVFHKEQILGVVPNFEKNEITEFSKELFLDLSSIEILTGTNIKNDNYQNIIINLDPRLGVYDEYPIYIDNLVINDKAKLEGKKTLIPFSSIAKELGYIVSWDSEKIKIYRPQDVAYIEYNLFTGFVNVNKIDIGIYPNVKDVDLINKKLPIDLAETLFAIKINISYDERKITISKNERLENTVLPDKKIDDELSNLGFQITDIRTQNSIPGGSYNEISGQYKNYYGSLKLNISENTNLNKYELNNLRLDFYDVWGPSGSVGLIGAKNRELSSIGSFSILGANYYLPKNDYALSIIAGELKDNIKTPSYGSVFGLKYYKKNNKDDKFLWETGLAIVENEKSHTKYNIVNSSIRKNKNKDDSFYYQLDMDFGNIKRYEQSNLSYKAKIYTSYVFGKDKEYSLTNDLNYTNKYFNDFEILENIKNNSYEFVQRDLITASAKLNLPKYEINNFNLYPSIKYEKSIKNHEDRDFVKNTDTLSLGISGQIYDTGYSLSLNNVHLKENISQRDKKYNDITLDITKKFETGELNLKMSNNLDTKEKLNNLSYNFEPFVKDIDGGKLTLTLSTGLYNGKIDKTKINAFANNASLSYNKNINGFDTSVGVGFNSSYNEFDKKVKNSNFLYAKIQKQIFDSTKAFATISQDAKGKLKFYLGIDLLEKINRPRTTNTLYKERGIIEGSIFISPEIVEEMKSQGININKNIQTMIKIKKTSLSLMSDKNGKFTIQNIPPGVYELELDNTYLPLNYLLKENTSLTIAVEAGKITTIDIPIIVVSNIKGKVKDNEEGIDIVLLNEKNKKITTTTGFAGIFIFDNVEKGNYKIIYKNKEICSIKVETGAKDYTCNEL